IPAPSPERGSHPHAPRCVRLPRTCSAFSTMSCERLPAIFTTNPTPHASCSCAGSYSPSGPGILLRLCMALCPPRIRERTASRCVAMAPAVAVGKLHALAIRVHRDRVALGVSRKHHHRLRPRHPLDRTDRTDEPLERCGVLGLHLEQHRVLAGNVVAFEDIFEQLDRLLEQSDSFRMGDRDANKCGDILAEAARIERRVITRDQTAV